LLRLADSHASYTPSGGAARTLYEVQPSYDAAGNVSGVTTTLPQGSDTQAFCYDAQNRLSWAGASGTPPCGATLTPGSLTAAQYSASYSYDTLNRLTSAPLGTYSYGDAAHLDAATAVGSTWTASYDAAGNMTCRAATSTTTCAGSTPPARCSPGTTRDGSPPGRTSRMSPPRPPTPRHWRKRSTKGPGSASHR
jgi:YD repeat-containing protein